MPTLDQPHHTLPATWNAEHVRLRLIEAAAVERRLPGQGARRLRSTWPGAVLHDWRDMVHWHDARDRVFDQWENAKGAYPYEVTRMEEAQAWLQWLPVIERQYIEAWSVCSARNLSVRAMLDKRGIKRTTFYRVLERASTRIAERLNVQGAAVR